MENWFLSSIIYDKTLENGTIKKAKEYYLIDALSFEEAEKRTLEELTPYIRGEFTICDIKRARLSELFLNENGDRYYKAKVYFITLDEKSGTEKKTATQMLIQASDIEEALSELKKGMTGTLADYTIVLLAETPIIDVFPYHNDPKKTEKEPD